MEDTWLTNLRLIKTDGVKGLNKDQLGKFKRELEENERDLRTIEHHMADRKVNPDEYRKLSQLQKQEENDFISNTRRDITQRNESLKGFLLRNKKTLGKSAARIAKKDLKESQKLTTRGISDLKKELKNANSTGVVMMLEDEIKQLQDRNAALKFTLEQKASKLEKLVMDLPAPLMGVSEVIDKVEEKGESEFGSLEAELEALDEEFNKILHRTEQELKDDVIDPIEEAYERLTRERFEDLEVRV